MTDRPLIQKQEITLSVVYDATELPPPSQWDWRELTDNLHPVHVVTSGMAHTDNETDELQRQADEEALELEDPDDNP